MSSKIQLSFPLRSASTQDLLCNLIYRHQGEVGIRRILGVLSLAEKCGTVVTEDACADSGRNSRSHRLLFQKCGVP